MAPGYAGSERTTRHAIASVKQAYRPGQGPGAPALDHEPGMWPQYDYDDGPV